MDPSIDPGSPQLRTTLDRPPTVGEWTLLQPFIAYAYKKKQHTARTIVEELKMRGFQVTDKVLRNRLKMWRLDNKNKRKAKDASAMGHKYKFAASMISDNDGFTSSTPDNSTESLIGHYLRTNDHKQHSVHATNSGQKDELLSGRARDIRVRAVCRSLSSPQQLQRERVVSGIANWYDHLSSRDAANFVVLPKHSYSNRLFHKLGYGLSLLCQNVPSGRKLLQEAGTEVADTLKSADPTLVCELMVNLLAVRTQGENNIIYLEHASVVNTFLARVSCEYLGAAHPVTILIETFARERMDPELCDMLCEAIKLNYVHNHPNADRQSRYQPYFCQTFGNFLLSQKRYLDVETWFERYSTDRESLHATTSDDLCTLSTLISARLCRGSYCEAVEAISQAMASLRKNGLQYTRPAIRIIELSVGLNFRLNDLVSCELLLKEHLNVALVIDDEDMVAHAAVMLWSFYELFRKLSLAPQLLETYLEVLDC